MAGLEEFSEAHARLNRESEPSVESQDGVISFSNLEIELNAAQLSKPNLQFLDEEPGKAVALVSRMGRKVMQPPSHSVVAAHYGGDDRIVVSPNAEKLWQEVLFLRDQLCGLVPRWVPW